MRLIDVISYNKGRGAADGNNYWLRYRTAHYVFVTAALFLTAVLMGLVSLFVCGVNMDHLGLEYFLSYFSNPLILLLNIAPCILLVFLVWFITGRAWIAVFVPSLAVYLFSLANYYKIRILNDTFTAGNFKVAGEALGVLDRYEVEITGRAILPVVILVVTTVAAALMARGKLRAPVVRIIGIILIIAICAGLYFFVYSSDAVYNKVTNTSPLISVNNLIHLDRYISRGFLYPFLYSVKDVFPQPPDGYSTAAAQEILAAAPQGDIPDGKKVNIISVMLEAYTDLSEIDGFEVEDFVYAPLHELQSESYHGYLCPNVFGGSTFNTERCFITGYSTLQDIESNTTSYVWYLADNGYYTEGIHPGETWFYNRANINRYLGFDNYYFLGTYDGLNRMDSTFFPAIKSLWEKRDASRPYFDFSVTYQNHGAYDATQTCEKQYVSRDGISEESYNILNNYLSGIADTTERISAFADDFRDIDEPVVLVFFGDHMPWLGNRDSVYADAGANIDRSTKDGFLTYYHSPYLIWANDAAKRVTGMDFTGEGPTISPCFLMNEIFACCGWDGPAYSGVGRELAEDVTIVNSAEKVYCADGEIVHSLSGEAADKYRDYVYAQYYIKNNFIY